MALDRAERIRLLEIAAETGANPFDIITTAQQMEAYVLGKPLSAVADQSWDGIPAASDSKN